jgi:Ketopantoate reductase PanE/ApbA
MNATPWPRVAVLGAGAVGCYFGGMLARAGAPLTLIGRPAHVDAFRRDGLLLDTLQFRERVPVAAFTDAAAVAGADFVSSASCRVATPGHLGSRLQLEYVWRRCCPHPLASFSDDKPAVASPCNKEDIHDGPLIH